MNDPFVDLIQVATDALEQLGIEYAVTGSIASSIHGEPVVSQDVDIVVRMTSQQARELADRLPARFYRSEDRLRYVAENGGVANLIDTETGLKVDLSVLPHTPFYDSLMSRRRKSSFGMESASCDIVTPEDIILMKLEWRKDTKSHKQWDNALSVMSVQRNRLDWKYMYQQAESLGVTDDLVRMRDEAGI